VDDTLAYDYAINKLRDFVKEKGFIEVPAQSRLNIMSACEDPSTVATFKIGGQVMPMIQSSQMTLEHEILQNQDCKGVYCMSTSYRDEPNIIEGRHCLTFPLFEIESFGGMEDMIKFQAELLDYLGFRIPSEVMYDHVCDEYGVKVIESEHEEKMQKEYGDVISLQYFPERANPFFNMNHHRDDLYEKVDVILAGQETIGSASRSCDRQRMYDNFMSISNGEYSQKLFDLFGKDRVMQELNTYLSLDFVPRYGMGIGVTRLCRALKECEIYG
tara:strand:- start:1 stop:816 length:816 start_codon:yes stop_codon:yes gene_type:complete